jgi:large subunit ribosomal protein L19
MTQQIIRQFSDKHNPASRWGDLEVGWTVRVHQKLKEGEKGKSQIFEGVIIARKHGNQAGATMTVRRVAGAYGVEKVYPLLLPSIEKIEVVKKGRTRRAKMYYLRDKTAKEIRRKNRAQATAAEKSEDAATPEVTPETAQ